ncbi:MAG: hypothetical protein HY000_32740 [Planctomycetes bacterium]|nr:hypothetical protein [Planctomycetota bacterium]
MDYEFSSQPLPGDLRYPLDRRDLDAVLEAGQVQNVSRVSFQRRPRGDRVLQADYWGEQPGSREGMAETFSPGTAWITVFAVPAEARDAVAATLRAEGLPRLGEWLQRAAAADEAWRASGHFIAISVVAERVAVTEH